MYGLTFDGRPWRTATVLACAVALGTGTAYGGDDVSHQEARRLVQEGRILPLAEILERAGDKASGDLLEVELELDDGAYVYELKILGPDGKVREIEIDAPTGNILDIEDDD
jgi:uncharacterized membrane protein YkoI